MATPSSPYLPPLLIAGPDSSLADAGELAREIWPQRRVQELFIPSRDYYHFDLDALAAYPAEEWEIALVVNEFYINDVRRALQEKISALGYGFISLISPQARVSPSARIGKNAIIHAGCHIGARSQIGDFVWLRPNCMLAEDVSLGDFVTLEANVSVREQSSIGSFVTVCSNSSLLRGTAVGAHSYLNLSRQYSGEIAAGTFFSPIFPEPIRVSGLLQSAA